MGLRPRRVRGKRAAAEGVTVIEYSLLLAAIAAAITLVFTGLGTDVANIFKNFSDTFSTYLNDSGGGGNGTGTGGTASPSSTDVSVSVSPTPTLTPTATATTASAPAP